MSSWNHGSYPEGSYHSGKKAWSSTDDWPSWSVARLESEAHINYLDGQVANLQSAITQLTDKLETQQAQIDHLMERACKQDELQFVVEQRKRGISDQGRQGIPPVALTQNILAVDPWQDAAALKHSRLPGRVVDRKQSDDAIRREIRQAAIQSIQQMDPWHNAAAQRQVISPGGVHEAGSLNKCSTLHSSHLGTEISPTLLKEMLDPQYSWISSVESKGLGRIQRALYRALNRSGAAWFFARGGKSYYTAQLACAHCCTMFQIETEYLANTFSSATEETLARFLLVEHDEAMQLRPEEWSH
jgi:hypothetical protein